MISSFSVVSHFDITDISPSLNFTEYFECWTCHTMFISPCGPDTFMTRIANSRTYSWSTTTSNEYQFGAIYQNLEVCRFLIAQGAMSNAIDSNGE